MDNSNMVVYNRLRRPPPTALRAIAGGRLKGKTDINPQWRYEAFTEVFGPIGFGWKYDIEKMWNEEGAAGERFAFVKVRLQVRVNPSADASGELMPVWSEPVVGIGGSMLIEREKEGLHNNDEAFKMATTDALSVAMKMFGAGADVYAGLWDGSKFKERGEDAAPAPAKKGKPAPIVDVPEMSDEQKKAADGFFDAIQHAKDTEELKKVGAVIKLNEGGLPDVVVEKLRGQFKARQSQLKEAV